MTKILKIAKTLFWIRGYVITCHMTWQNGECHAVKKETDRNLSTQGLKRII
jgi:hypothetical protein